MTPSDRAAAILAELADAPEVAVLVAAGEAQSHDAAKAAADAVLRERGWRLM